MSVKLTDAVVSRMVEQLESAPDDSPKRSASATESPTAEKRRSLPTNSSELKFEQKESEPDDVLKRNTSMTSSSFGAPSSPNSPQRNSLLSGNRVLRRSLSISIEDPSSQRTKSQEGLRRSSTMSSPSANSAVAKLGIDIPKKVPAKLGIHMPKYLGQKPASHAKAKDDESSECSSSSDATSSRASVLNDAKSDWKPTMPTVAELVTMANERDLKRSASIEIEFLDTPDTDKSNMQQKLYRIITSPKYNVCVGLVICLNTMVMGMELDTQQSAKSSDQMLSYVKYPEFMTPEFFQALETVFSIFFVIEFGVRYYVYRSKMFKELFTYIDILALLPTFLNLIITTHGLTDNMVILRIMRLLKLCRLLRLIKMCKELYVLVSSFLAAFRTLFWVAALLFIILYCAAVFCTILIGQNPHFLEDNETMKMYVETYGLTLDRDRCFGSIMRSVFTLFQIFTLDNWNLIVRPIVETHQPWMFFFFVGFIFLTTFGLLNLLVGVIVDTTVNAAKNIEAEREQLLHEGSHQTAFAAVRLFSLMDADGNGTISPSELFDFLEDPDNTTKFSDGLPFDLDIEEFHEICQVIADEWLDPTNPCADGLTVGEFAGAAIRLSGPAQSRDVLATRILLKSIMARTDDQARYYHERHATIDAKLDKVLEKLGESGAPGSPKDLSSTLTSRKSRDSLTDSPLPQYAPSASPLQSQSVLGSKGLFNKGWDMIKTVQRHDKNMQSFVDNANTRRSIPETPCSRDSGTGQYHSEGNVSKAAHAKASMLSKAKTVQGFPDAGDALTERASPKEQILNKEERRASKEKAKFHTTPAREKEDDKSDIASTTAGNNDGQPLNMDICHIAEKLNGETVTTLQTLRKGSSAVYDNQAQQTEPGQVNPAAPFKATTPEATQSEAKSTKDVHNAQNDTLMQPFRTGSLESGKTPTDTCAKVSPTPLRFEWLENDKMPSIETSNSDMLSCQLQPGSSNDTFVRIHDGGTTAAGLTNTSLPGYLPDGGQIGSNLTTKQPPGSLRRSQTLPDGRQAQSSTQHDNNFSSTYPGPLPDGQAQRDNEAEYVKHGKPQLHVNTNAAPPTDVRQTSGRRLSKDMSKYQSEPPWVRESVQNGRPQHHGRHPHAGVARSSSPGRVRLVEQHAMAPRPPREHAMTPRHPHSAHVRNHQGVMPPSYSTPRAPYRPQAYRARPHSAVYGRPCDCMYCREIQSVPYGPNAEVMLVSGRPPPHVAGELFYVEGAPPPWSPQGADGEVRFVEWYPDQMDHQDFLE